MTRHLIVSDIHGCFDEFMQLLDEVKFRPSSGDILISAGDLVEKGPKSNDVATFFRRTPNAFSIMGNHEEGLVRYWRHEIRKRNERGYKNPMEPYEDRVKTLATMDEENLNYLSKLPLFRRIGDRAIVVHGGIFPDTAPENMNEKVICRLRYIRKKENGRWSMVRMGKEREDDIYWAEAYNGKEFAIFGHQSFIGPAPRRFPNAVGIDLGGCYAGHLCAYILEDDAHVSVKVETQYAEPILIMSRTP